MSREMWSEFKVELSQMGSNCCGEEKSIFLIITAGEDSGEGVGIRTGLGSILGFRIGKGSRFGKGDWVGSGEEGKVGEAGWLRLGLGVGWGLREWLKLGVRFRSGRGVELGVRSG